MAERGLKSATGTASGRAKVRRCVACERTECSEVPLEERKLGDGTNELLCVNPIDCRLAWQKRERESNVSEN